MRPITTGQNAVNIQYAVLHVAFNVNVDSDLQEQWLVYLPWELWLLLFQRFTGHVFEWWVSWQYFWFYCQVISFVVDLVGRRGCMILGSNLGRPRETPKLEWRCPGLEVEFKTHSCNIYSALMSQGGATFCVGATVQGTCSQPQWFLIRGSKPDLEELLKYQALGIRFLRCSIYSEHHFVRPNDRRHAKETWVLPIWEEQSW